LFRASACDQLDSMVFYHITGYLSDCDFDVDKKYIEALF